MNKRRKLLLSGILLFCFAFLVTAGCGFSHDYINHEIKNAKACTKDTDCISVGSKCPFGCSIVVNKTESYRIGSLVDNYSTNCAYDCLPPDKVVCENKMCVQKYKDGF